MKENHPGFPDDQSSTYFNEAHPSLWLPEPEMFFEGNEAFMCQGFTHDDDVISGYLPNYRVRLFSWAKSEPEKSIPEIIENPVQLDTVVLIPDQCLGFCIYRSILDSDRDPLLLKLACLMVAYERRTGDPRPVKHYTDYLHRRTKSQPEIADLLDTQSLSPILTPEEQAEQIEKEIQEIYQEQQKINQQKQRMQQWFLQEAQLTQLPENPFQSTQNDSRTNELHHITQSLSNKKKQLSEDEIEKLITKVQTLTGEMVDEHVASVPDNTPLSLKPPPPIPRHPTLLEQEITTRLTKSVREEIKKQLGDSIHQLPLTIDQHVDHLIEARRIANEPITIWPEMTKQDGLTFGTSFTNQVYRQKDFSLCDLADLIVSNQYFTHLLFIGTFLERGNVDSCHFTECDFTQVINMSVT